MTGKSDATGSQFGVQHRNAPRKTKSPLFADTSCAVTVPGFCEQKPRQAVSPAKLLVFVYSAKSLAFFKKSLSRKDARCSICICTVPLA